MTRIEELMFRNVKLNDLNDKEVKMLKHLRDK